MTKLYYGDFTVGDTYEFDGIQVSKEEIIAFGNRYDPLPFHTDEAAATETPFNGVIASGLQTFALSQRQIVDQLYQETHLIGSVGFDKVLFPHPVRPGDTLHTTLQVVETRPSRSNPSRGLVTLERTVRNQDDELVLRAINNVLFKRKDAHL